MMISWLARVNTQAGHRGQAGVRLSPDIVAATWLVRIHTAGDVPAWKTKQLLSTLSYSPSAFILPLRSSFVLIKGMIKNVHVYALPSIYIHICDLMVPVMEECKCKWACNEGLR